jgi:hypothetical protein
MGAGRGGRILATASLTLNNSETRDPPKPSLVVRVQFRVRRGCG